MRRIWERLTSTSTLAATLVLCGALAASAVAQTSSNRPQHLDLGADFRRSDNVLIVSAVREDGFLATAGVREGDRVVSVDGSAVTSEEEFRRLLAGGHGRVTVRNGERHRLTLNLEEQGQGNLRNGSGPNA
jgi:S1-C subfamily serine protease